MLCLENRPRILLDNFAFCVILFIYKDVGNNEVRESELFHFIRHFKFQTGIKTSRIISVVDMVRDVLLIKGVIKWRKEDFL